MPTHWRSVTAPPGSRPSSPSLQASGDGGQAERGVHGEVVGDDELDEVALGWLGRRAVVQEGELVDVLELGDFDGVAPADDLLARLAGCDCRHQITFQQAAGEGG